MEIIVNEKKSNKFDKNKMLSILKNKYLVILLIILVIALVVRFNYYNINEAVWWDSADHLTGAKVMYNSELRENLSQYQISPKRPFFLSLFFGLILYLGGGEKALHFSVLIFSFLGVLFTYLIGREMYNRKVGLIASSFMVFLWLHLFYTTRLLTDIIALTFWLGAVYFFWKGYINKKGNRNILYAGIFMGFSIFTRAASIINFIPLLILVLVKERLSVFKNKNLLLFLVLMIVVLSPFIIWLNISFDNPMEKFLGIGGGGRFKEGITFKYFSANLPIVQSMIFTPVFSQFIKIPANILTILIFIFIFVVCWDLFLGLDILVKERKKSLLKKLFLFFWFFMPFVAYSFIVPGTSEPRYFFAMAPVVFILFGYSMNKLLKKKNLQKYIILVVLVIILIFSVGNLSYADKAIKKSSRSFAEVAYGGKWIKDNSKLGDNVISASKYQNMYYSERDTFHFPKEEKEFEDYLKEVNPRYVVISIYEPGFTPGWVLEYPGKHPELLRPVRGYFADEAKIQPVLIIYEYSGYT